VRELKDQRTFVPERTLTNVVAHAPGVTVASVSARRGKLHVDVRFEEVHRAFALVPLAARFAPRGAKELLFRVEPPELSGDVRVRDLTGAIVGAVARQVWAVAVRASDEELAGAIVDRDGTDCVRVDLRSVPAVRAMLRERNPAAVVIEMLEIKELTADDGELAIKLKLPQLAP